MAATWLKAKVVKATVVTTMIALSEGLPYHLWRCPRLSADARTRNNCYFIQKLITGRPNRTFCGTVSLPFAGKTTFEQQAHLTQAQEDPS